MAYFEVKICGSGIECEIPPGSDPIRGFYTTRRVWASDPVTASERAKQLVSAEWDEGGAYAEPNKLSAPFLEIEQTHPIGFLRGAFTRKPAGYTFFLND